MFGLIRVRWKAAHVLVFRLRKELKLITFLIVEYWSFKRVTMTDPTKEATSKEYTLERDCELRFEIESKIQVVVEVCFVYIS